MNNSKAFLPVTFIFAIFVASFEAAESRPNILFCISDDQSYALAGANGDQVVKTPGFDRVAREGLRFIHAFCDAPTCGPSRSAILTGQPIWRLEEAGNIHSTLPAKFATYTELLEDVGYAIGFTGKGWSPGRLEAGGRTTNPAGPRFEGKELKPPFKGMTKKDYAGNFDEFLAQVSKDQPFCFWLGTHEPHRGFENGAGRRTGKDPAKVVVPPIFPDHPIVRSDILDYYVEIEHFDRMVARAIKTLETAGQLDNTIVVITSDHGMPFPRCKGQAYDYSNHIPLAIRWPQGIKGSNRQVDDFVNFTDLAPTFLEAAGVKQIAPLMQPVSGHSLFDIFASDKSGQVIASRDHVLLGKERHDVGRPNNGGYPIRGIRKGDHLYLHNFEPDRWPGGNPETGYLNCDASPIKTLLLNQRRTGDYKFWRMNFGKRPTEELFNVTANRDCVKDLAQSKAQAKLKTALKTQLFNELKEQGDPRMFGRGAVFDQYGFASEMWNNFYEKFQRGQKIRTGWVLPSDYEKEKLD